MGRRVGVDTNFGFLESHSPMLYKLAQQAERYFAEYPNTSLIKLRQFGEVLARQMAALTNTSLQPGASQVEVINALRYEGSLSDEAANGFHTLRKSGNRATHEMTGAHSEALSILKVARALGSYYHQVKVDRSVRLGPFIPPPDPKKQAAAVAEQMAALQQQLQDALQAQAQAEALAEAEAALGDVGRQVDGEDGVQPVVGPPLEELHHVRDPEDPGEGLEEPGGLRFAHGPG